MDIKNCKRIVEAGAFKAYEQDLPAALQQLGVKPEDDAGVASWFVEAPWAHPAWNNYWLYICHLRPMPDNRPTMFYLEGATHEMWLYAMNPDWQIKDMIEQVKFPFLTPKNFAVQLKLDSDEAAAKLLEGAAMDVLNQRMNPDTDYITTWWAKYGDNMRRKGL
jgi:hypothetical protein